MSYLSCKIIATSLALFFSHILTRANTVRDFKLFALDAVSDELVKINLENETLSVIGPIGVDIKSNATMDFNPADGHLYFSQSHDLFRLNPNTGTATLVSEFNSTDDFVAIITFSTDGKLLVHFEQSAWGQGFAYEYEDLTFKEIRSLGYPNASLRSILGIDFDGEGNLWAVDENLDQLFD